MGVKIATPEISSDARIESVTDLLEVIRVTNICLTVFVNKYSSRNDINVLWYYYNLLCVSGYLSRQQASTAGRSVRYIRADDARGLLRERRGSEYPTETRQTPQLACAAQQGKDKYWLTRVNILLCLPACSHILPFLLSFKSYVWFTVT